MQKKIRAKEQNKRKSPETVSPIFDRIFKFYRWFFSFIFQFFGWAALISNNDFACEILCVGCVSHKESSKLHFQGMAGEKPKKKSLSIKRSFIFLPFIFWCFILGLAVLCSLPDINIVMWIVLPTIITMFATKRRANR